MLPIKYIALFAFLVLFFSLSAETDGFKDEASVVKADVELLIVCDKAFSDRFGQDHQKIIDYWAVYMRDVDSRFKTLQGVDVSFRVTSLVSIKDEEDQPFIKYVTQVVAGEYSLMFLEENFQKWVYANKHKFPSFDVAILITDLPLWKDEAAMGATYHYKSACREYQDKKEYKGIIVLNGAKAMGHACDTLPRALGHTLGAPYDKDTACYTEYGMDYYLMSPRKYCTDNQYIFSPCSGEHMAAFFKSSSANCVRESDNPSEDVLRSSVATHPPSLQDQCRMLTGQENVIAEHDKYDCITTSCSVWKNGDISYKKLLTPPELSPCDNGTEKICFRGKCVPRGRLLRNMGAEQCMYSSDRFSMADKPVMDNCTGSPRPLDQFMLLERPFSQGKLLAVPYDLKEKCLASGFTLETLYTLKFTTCSGRRRELEFYDEENKADYPFGDFIQVDGKETGDFILYNRYAKACARAEVDGMVKLVNKCDKNDARMRWSFVDTPVVTMGWFNNHCEDVSKRESTTEPIKSEL